MGDGRTRSTGRAYGYARVSSAEQGEHGTSLDAQRDEIVRYCAAHGLPSPTLHVEVESGGAEKVERRVELARLLAAAQPGDVVIVCAVDRWSRDIVHAVQSVRALVARGVGWVSIREAIDAATPHGDSTLGILSWVADQERRRIRTRTVGSRQRLRALGHHVEGAPPLGYRVEARKLVPDPETASVVREMYRRCVAGESTREIARALQAAHPDVPGLDHALVAVRLRSRVYAGDMLARGTRGSQAKRRAGEWVEDTHEPLVDRATWYRAQHALAGRRRGGRPASGDARTASWSLRGLVVCGHCGHVLASHATTPRRATEAEARAGWYQCGRCDGRPRVPHVELERVVEAAAAVRLEELAERLARPAAPVAPPDVAKLDAKRAALLTRRERLVRAVADGTLTSAEARAQLDRVAAQIAAVDEERAAATAPAEAPEDRAARLADVEALRGAWAHLAGSERREALRALGCRVVVWSTRERQWQRGAWRCEVGWAER